MISQKVFDSIDGLFFVVLFVIIGIGLLTLYSLAPTAAVSRTFFPLYLKQLLWFFVGMVAFLLFVAIDYHKWARWAYVFYVVTLLLLIVVAFVGRTVYGAQRWISFGFFSVQPSELAKVSLVLVLARYLSDHALRSDFTLDFMQLIIPGCIFLVPFVLVLKQPDLGTALALVVIFFCVIAIRGLRLKFVISSVLLFITLSPFIGQIVWTNLKDYQKERIAIFLDPLKDPSGSGWHIIQSRIAVGSGGVWGQGMAEGTQSQLKFLPKSSTDFIFSAFSEAWGFIGVLVLFLLFSFLFWWITDVARKSKDLLGILMVMGSMGMIVYDFFVNVGMAMGILPVVGVPLPLVSYGGSSLVVHLALLGLIMNIKIRRLMLFY